MLTLELGKYLAIDGLPLGGLRYFSSSDDLRLGQKFSDRMSQQRAITLA